MIEPTTVAADAWLVWKSSSKFVSLGILGTGLKRLLAGRETSFELESEGGLHSRGHRCFFEETVKRSSQPMLASIDAAQFYPP